MHFCMLENFNARKSKRERESAREWGDWINSRRSGRLMAHSFHFYSLIIKLFTFFSTHWTERTHTHINQNYDNKNIVFFPYFFYKDEWLYSFIMKMFYHMPAIRHMCTQICRILVRLSLSIDCKLWTYGFTAPRTEIAWNMTKQLRNTQQKVLHAKNLERTKWFSFLIQHATSLNSSKACTETEFMDAKLKLKFLMKDL